MLVFGEKYDKQIMYVVLKWKRMHFSRTFLLKVSCFRFENTKCPLAVVAGPRPNPGSSRTTPIVFCGGDIFMRNIHFHFRPKDFSTSAFLLRHRLNSYKPCPLPPLIISLVHTRGGEGTELNSTEQFGTTGELRNRSA